MDLLDVTVPGRHNFIHPLEQKGEVVSHCGANDGEMVLSVMWYERVTLWLPISDRDPNQGHGGLT
jgi:hypothetical protein